MFSSIYKDFKGWSWGELSYLVLALVVVCVGSYTGSPLEFAAALTNVLCVLLVAKGRISNYYWGLAGVILYAIVAYKAQLYANMGLNIFYVPLQFWGVYEWRKAILAKEAKYLQSHYQRGKHRGLGLPTDFVAGKTASLSKEEDVEVTFHNETLTEKKDVPVRTLTYVKFLRMLVAVVAGTGLVSWYLAAYTQDPSPVLDAFTMVASLVAMYLMIKQYSEQWILWNLVNAVTIYLWVSTTATVTGSWTMVAMWSVFQINSLYGAYKWYIVKRGK